MFNRSGGYGHSTNGVYVGEMGHIFSRRSGYVCELGHSISGDYICEDGNSIVYSKIGDYVVRWDTAEMVIM